MAVSFPSNPVSGDEHINNGSVYVYDATKGIWNSKATLTTGDVQGFNLQPASATPSDTAPANPDTGDMWYDTANLDLYVYNGNFWVQTNTEAVPVPEDVSDLTDTTGLITNVVALTHTGELSTYTGTKRWYAPKNITINKIKARVDTAPTGAGVVIQINRTTTGNVTTNQQLTIADGTTLISDTSPTISSMSEDDYLTIDIVSVGTTTAGENLTVEITYK